MKSSKYEYLNEYINHTKQNISDNWFGSITVEEIEKSEQRLGFEFPKLLKEFWKEIGYGFFNSDITRKKTTSCTNRLMDPASIADIILLKEESGLILPETVEYMTDGYVGDGDILFFEIGDLSSFLMMKCKSDKPNAIYNMLGEVIEEDFETFIKRLYYESPTYYLYI
jgi:hypothetical protein